MGKAFVASTLRMHIFQILAIIGCIATLCVAIIITSLTIYTTRDVLKKELIQSVSVTANIVSLYMKHEDSAQLSTLIKLLPHPDGLQNLCIYSNTNQLIGQWHANDTTLRCPVLAREIGITDHFFTLTIAEPIKNNAIYLGIVYADASLIPLKTIITDGIFILGGLVVVTFITCYFAAYYSAHHINYLFDAIREQIECLKSNSKACLLSPSMATQETFALFEAIQQLRMHLMTFLVPKESVTYVHQWYSKTILHVFALIGEKTKTDSPLYPLLKDYELLLRMHYGETVSETSICDLTQLIDEGHATARAFHPPGNQVHLVVSFKSVAEKKWKLQPDYFKIIIRHLLLIAISRTPKGLICLRLEIAPHPEKSGQAMIVWALEDSGLPMQPGILHSKLKGSFSHLIESFVDLSWMLVGQMTKMLGGSIYGENTANGLQLRGSIPLLYGECMELVHLKSHDVPVHTEAHPRLILIVTTILSDRSMFHELFLQFNCRIFWVENYMQALEWAPAMPFSAILLNASFINADGITAIRHLRTLMDNKLMPTIPIWMLTSSQILNEQVALYDAGISKVLHIPLKHEILAPLCQALLPFDPEFWASYDGALLQELSPTMATRLPEMRGELLLQLEALCTHIKSLNGKTVTLEVMHCVHGVKSAALAMGYMHLAVLMANIEHWLVQKNPLYTQENCALLLDCIKSIRLH